MARNFMSFGDAETIISEVADKIEHLTFVGTQAEWDSKSTDEKKKYSVADITDDGDGTPDYYSTTETKTNKIWIDGKPIYRKVYSGLSTNYGTANWANLGIYISVLNIDTLLFVHGLSNIFNNERFRISADQLQLAALIDSATLTNLIIEYTKTTD